MPPPESTAARYWPLLSEEIESHVPLGADVCTQDCADEGIGVGGRDGTLEGKGEGMAVGLYAAEGASGPDVGGVVGVVVGG